MDWWINDALDSMSSHKQNTYTHIHSHTHFDMVIHHIYYALQILSGKNWTTTKQNKIFIF